MLGVIAGDIIGSVYEFTKHKQYDFMPLFHEKAKYTDDTICVTAVMKSLANNTPPIETMHAHCREYFSTGGWGKMFVRWMGSKDPQPYGSYGNGSAMRIAPVGWVANTEEEVISLSDSYTEITHNHEEGMKTAKATALAVFYAKQGLSVNDMRMKLSEYYDLDFTISDIRATYQRTEVAAESVPQAIVAALEATSFEDAIRLAVSLGGDTDTQAAIAGGIAEARFSVPEEIKGKVFEYLDDNLRQIVEKFYAQCAD